MTQNDTPLPAPTTHRTAYWSGHTLRIETLEVDHTGLVIGVPHTEDCLCVHGECIQPHDPWGDLIVRLLNEHLAGECR